MAPGIDSAVFRPQDTNVTIPHFDSKTPTVGITELPPSPIENSKDSTPSSTLVFDPTTITQEFDLLRFAAAAFSQLPLPSSTPISLADTDSTTHDTSPEILSSQSYSSLLISSPYNNPGHYLDLTAVPTQSLLFAKALTALQPTRPDYATAPYTSALNFPFVLSVLRDLSTASGHQWRETSFYVVVFRSKLKEGIDNDWLYKLDYESHREACESGGLLKYWFGRASAERRNLATCFWHCRADAYKGGLGPWHKKARAAGRELYERIVFSTHRFTVLDGAEEFRFEDWKE